MQLIICKITSVFPQTLIRYILKQDLPMSLEDSLTLAEAYKLPTSQINYLYVIHLIGQGKVCKSSQEFLIACYWLILLFCVPFLYGTFCTVFFCRLRKSWLSWRSCPLQRQSVWLSVSHRGPGCSWRTKNTYLMRYRREDVTFVEVHFMLIYF